MKKYYIYTNGTDSSNAVISVLKEKFSAAGLCIADSFTKDTDFILCVGGDGTLLRLLPTLNYPQIPIIGINTGHMGFFQEFESDQIDELVELCCSGKYTLQHHKLLRAEVYKNGSLIGEHKSINDVTIRNNIARLTHLKVSIGDTFIERFSGDGVIISTPVGSTAYNYSVGGAIIDPRNDVLQISPIAPMNSVAFRSFTSSLLLPPGLEVVITPDEEFERTAIIMLDGFEYYYSDFDEIRVGMPGEEVIIVRGEKYDFWSKVTEKFL